MIFRCKKIKKCVKIANRSEIDKKEVKIGRVGLLPSVSCMQVKAHVGRQDPAHAGPFPHMQSLQNRAAYARIELRTYESKLRTQV